MGNKTYTMKVRAEASLGAGVPSVDALTLSSSASRCWGRGRRRLARFTFPRRGWVCTQGVQVCRGREQQYLPLVGLHREDPSTTLRVKCSCRGATVYAATMPLACLLGLLEEAVAGDTALLLFTLTGGEEAGGQLETTLTFTRPRYARPWACNGWLRSHGGGTWEHVGPGDAACLSPSESGCGAPASPEQQEVNQGQGQHGPALADKAAEGSASAFLEVPQPVLRSLTASDQEYTVPAVQCGDHSASAKDVAVPEVDMGEPPTLALYRALHQTEPEPYQGDSDSAQNTTVPGAYCRDPPSTTEALEAVPEVDLRESSCLALYLHKTEPNVGVPPPSAQDSAVPEADLGESSSLALYYALHQTAPEPDEGDPPASAEAREEVPDEDSLEPAPSALEASPPRLERPWWHAVLEGLEVLDLIVYSVLILDACLR